MGLDSLINEAKRNGGHASITFCHGETGAQPSLSAQLRQTIYTSAVPSNRNLPLAGCGIHQSVSVAITRARQKHLIAKWVPRKQCDNAKVLIPLFGTNSFSTAFSTALGTANTTNISDLEDDQVLESFFEAFLEREASCQFRSGRNKHLQEIMNINEGWNRDGMTVSGELGTDNELRWSLNSGITKGTSWTRLLRYLFNLSRMDAIATLANILGISFENFYQLSSEKYAAELNGRALQYEDVPVALNLQGGGVVSLKEKIYIYGNAGQQIGAILCYQWNDNYFCLPATVVRGVLCMGKCKPTAYFFNQHLMDMHPFAKVLLCQDMRTAYALQRLLEQTRGYNPAEIIVTAHLGNDLSILPWSYFHGHDVVFVPAPTKVCMSKVNLYNDYIMGAQAKSFQVYPGFLLHSQPCCDLTGHVEGCTEAEEELLRKAVWLDTVDRPRWRMEQVVRDAVPYAGYLVFGRTLDIFKTPKEQDVPLVTTSADELALFSPHAGNIAQQPRDIADVTVQHIFSAQRNILLHGLKDAGKSFVCLAITQTLVKGNSLFGCIPSNNESNVMFINSETPKEDFLQRLEQFDIVDELGRHLFVLSKYDHAASDCAFSLTDPLFCEKIEDLMKNKGCSYLILDNLTTLMKEGQATQTIAVNKVYDWLERVQQRGICVVVVHHTLDDGNAGTMSAKARGSADTSNRNHGELVLIGSTQILEKKLGTEAIQRAAAQDGLTVGICFKVCKAACVLQKKIFWLHLPLGAPKWEFLAVTRDDGEEIPFTPVDYTLLADPELEAEHMISGLDDTIGTELVGLSEEERQIYEYAKKTGEISTKDVKKRLCCGDTKAREILQNLVKKGILIHNKKGGAATAYILKH